MFKIRYYLQLLRIHHYIKNFLILIPLFFSKFFLNTSLVTTAVLGFVCFSLLSSIVYIFNDVKDIEKDRLHNTKNRRPLASGKIPVLHAILILIIISTILSVLLIMLRIQGKRLFNINSIALMFLYVVLNIAYSLGVKNIPIVDVTILASGYVIRVLFGAMIIDVNISIWLYLVITLGAYYMGLGKRRNEIIDNQTETRTVMKYYSHNFLDKNMYVCQALCIVFYSLWSIDSVTVERFNTNAFVYTVPLVLIIFLKYSLNIETEAEGDPTSVLLGDKILLLLCVIYIICVFFIIFLNRVTS